ncbi:hypothetical protein [Limosilactobacillus vaginalis]|uniref:hypothetical protein n=1 Tax=Limosilactobacillus vaginalis TaxID=1633 RepID=UPI0024BADA3F|nr:hypothetical protein [Limosilactobacillus vaginalis]
MGGVNALKIQVGNYNILYQFIISLLTYIPIKDIYLYKFLSVIFDYVLAISSGFIVFNLSNSDNGKKLFIFTYALILLLPTTVLNSALWAQCDSIYASFIVLALLLLIKKRYKTSFVFMGIALSFKLQAIFVFPLFLLMWLINKRIYLLHFLLTIFTFWISGLPAYIFGRSLLTPFKIYLTQTSTYKSLFMNYFNFSGLFQVSIGNRPYYVFLSKEFILSAFMILIVGYLYLIINSNFTSNVIIGTSIWTIYTCIMFLPAIHERYSYIVDILLVILSVIYKRYILVAIPEILDSLLGYNSFLFSNIVNVIGLSYISVIVYMMFTLMILNDCKKEFRKSRIIDYLN